MKNDPGEKTVVAIPCAQQWFPKLHRKSRNNQAAHAV